MPTNNPIPEFDPKHINELGTDRDRKLMEIAHKVDPNDEQAIDMYAEEMAMDVCRAGLRDIAASIKKGMADKAKDVDFEKLAEEALPQTDFYQEAVSDLKTKIYDAMRMIGKAKDA